MKTLIAAALIVGTLAPGIAAAASFGDTNVDPGMNNMNALMLPSRMARDQAELERLQMDLEDRRAQRAMRCVLPDGRRVECR